MLVQTVDSWDIGAPKSSWVWDTSKPVDRRAWATFDPARIYRYTLGRLWRVDKPRCLFVMLNPSIGTASVDDPTIRRCVDFAQRWGCGSLEIGNLFAYRSTDPRELHKQADPVGPKNDEVLLGLQRRAKLVVAAWGLRGKLHHRDREVLYKIGDRGPIHCLGLTKGGQPVHPLYVPAETKLQVLDSGGC